MTQTPSIKFVLLLFPIDSKPIMMVLAYNTEILKDTSENINIFIALLFSLLYFFHTPFVSFHQTKQSFFVSFLMKKNKVK